MLRHVYSLFGNHLVGAKIKNNTYDNTHADLSLAFIATKGEQMMFLKAQFKMCSLPSKKHTYTSESHQVKGLN